MAEWSKALCLGYPKLKSAVIRGVVSYTWSYSIRIIADQLLRVRIPPSSCAETLFLSMFWLGGLLFGWWMMWGNGQEWLRWFPSGRGTLNIFESWTSANIYSFEEIRISFCEDRCAYILPLHWGRKVHLLFSADEYRRRTLSGLLDSYAYGSLKCCYFFSEISYCIT